MRNPTLAGETAGFQEGQFRRGGDPPQHRVAVREAPKAGDDVEVHLGPVGLVVEPHGPEGGDAPVLGVQILGMFEGHDQPAGARGDELLVPAGEGAGPAVERWYRRQARAEAQARLAEACAALGASHGPVSIRDQRSRWGSCASSGAISMNWRLMLAPSEVFGYVAWHEACHLVVADHSPRFWALLESHLPGYREPRQWLRSYGTALSLPPLSP